MITKRAYAKINISLDIISKRNDGYHNIKTLMTKTNLFDEIVFEKNKKVEILPDFEFDYKSNYIYKAYEVLRNEVGFDLPFKVKVNKKIPIAAGLAGGTSNGAVTFYALNELYNLNISRDDLIEMARPLGADFTYMMVGKSQIATGIGDILERVRDIKLKNLLLVNPGFGISTVEVYKNTKINEKRINFKEILDGIYSLDIDKLNFYMGNKMEEFVLKKYKEIKDIKDKLISMNSAALMSGSGASVFAIFENEKDRDLAYDFYKKIYDKTFKVEVGDNCGSI